MKATVKFMINKVTIFGLSGSVLGFRKESLGSYFGLAATLVLTFFSSFSRAESSVSKAASHMGGRALASASESSKVTPAGHTGQKVFFVSPKDGSGVTKKIKIVFGVEGMEVAPAVNAENKVNKPGTGHHHLIIDGSFIPKGQAVPSDATHVHFGKGQKETELELTPGHHKITLQFADGNHISYGEEMSQTISVDVK